MRYSRWMARGLGISALLIVSASPAFAQSKTDRARTAIVEARAKIDAAVKVGATGEAPRLVAQAQASLRAAEEDLARSRELDAIADAHRASALADEALGVAEQGKREDAVAARERAADAENAAVAERARSATAENAAASAQASAADANARADAAQQAAAASAAEAAAARATPPPQPTTTVTVERQEQATVTPAAAPVARKKVVRRTAARRAPVRRVPAATTKTTTTITTRQQR
ncbi:MAG: hypothetical protein V4574_05775 [Pseudomonadota bacterium]